MNLVTIYPGHNASVAYFADGECLKVVHEEKFSNVKNHLGFPHQSLKYLAQLYDFTKVDGFSFPFTDILWMCLQLENEPGQCAPDGTTYRVGNVLEDLSRSWLRSVFDFVEYHLPFKLFYHLRNLIVRHVIAPRARQELKIYLKKTYGVSADKIRYFDHHFSHIASSLYFYNLRDLGQDVLLLSMDGAGDGNFATVYVYRAATAKLERIAKSDFDASLGLLYSGLTRFLGMKPNEHEYKVMGLAAYVTEKKYYQRSYDKFAKLVRLDEDTLTFTSPFNLNLTLTSLAYLKQNFLGERFDNVSAGLQNFLEDIVCRWIQAAVKKTGISVIACSGGVFMNVKMNQRIQSLPEVAKVFFMPSCGDESTVLGCAPVIYQERGIKTRSDGTLYKGLAYTNDQVERFLKDQGWFEKYEVARVADIEQKTAELLRDFNIVARFKGACEWGARSLCNRAILGNASDLKTFYEVNDMIKMRDFWMPFAPTLLDAWAGRYVQDWQTLAPKVGHSAGYMITTFDATPLAQQHLRAAIHQKDKTLRPQIVREADNPELYHLLKYYESLTGMGGLMNTSLNIHGYPMVGTLEQAAFTFENSGLVYMTLENFLIKKKEQSRQ
jgi:carbamoyltransferase